MNTLKLALKLLYRDWKAGELTVLATALIVAVTALTAVAFLTDRVGHAVELRAAESLAGDLRLASTREISSDYDVLAAEHGLQTARISSMPSVIFAADTDANTLAAIRAVTEGYPLRGQVKTADKLLAEARVVDDIPAAGEAWASQRLLARLGVDVGTVVEVGSTRLLVSRVLDFRPDQGFSFVDLAPTLLINRADLAATELIQPGSRVAYRMLFAGEREQLAAFREVFELGEGERLSDIEDASPQIRSAMDRAGRFLNLASLVSVLLAAVAVAMAARRYSQRHRDRIALLKCLGSQQGFILRVSMIQLILLAVTGAVLGSVLGYLSQNGLAWLMRDFIQQTLPPPGWQPAALGLVTAVTILAGFALPDLLQMGRTPPMRVLRNDLEPPPLRFGLSWIAAVIAVVALLMWMIQDFRLVMMIFIGTAMTFAVLGIAGWILVKALQRFRGAAGIAWRYGLANISRRGRESIVQIVAFGLGLMVLLLLTVVRNELMDNWQNSLPDNAPNQFLINIQPYEVDPMQAFLEERGFDVPRFVPLVRARMTHINDQDIKEMQFESVDAQQWAERDANLSWAEELQTDNHILEGEWWSQDLSMAEVSLEQDFASDVGLVLGDELSFDIAGQSLTATVSSIRSVEWDSFQPNFFMVFSPGSLDGYPASFITSLYTTEETQDDMLELMRRFPSVTAIDLDAVLGQVRDVMDKSSLAVQAVFLFTLLAGLTVLWAAVQGSRDERRYESAMLRTLGASRSRVLAGVASEFLAIGLLAGVLAATGASLAGYFLAENLFELDYQFSWALWFSGPLLGMVFVGISGLVASYRVISHAPVTVLKGA